MLAGLAGSLLRLTQVVWMGEGMIGFFYLVVIFLPGFILSLALLHRRLRKETLRAGRQLPLSFAWGFISYPAVDQVGDVIPVLIERSGHFDALPTLALIGLEVVVAGLIVFTVAILLFALIRSSQ